MNWQSIDISISSLMQVKELESLMVLHDVQIVPPSNLGRGSALQPGSPGRDSVHSMASHRSASPTTGGPVKAGSGSPHSNHQARAPSIKPSPSIGIEDQVSRKERFLAYLASLQWWHEGLERLSWDAMER